MRQCQIDIREKTSSLKSVHLPQLEKAMFLLHSDKEVRFSVFGVVKSTMLNKLLIERKTTDVYETCDEPWDSFDIEIYPLNGETEITAWFVSRE